MKKPGLLLPKTYFGFKIIESSSLILPAQEKRTSILQLSSICLIAALTLSKLVTSADIDVIICSGYILSFSRDLEASSSCNLFLAIIITFAPFFNSCDAIACPNPELPPVITQFFSILYNECWISRPYLGVKIKLFCRF